MKCIVHDKSMKHFSIEAEVVRTTNTLIYIKPIYSMGLVPVTPIEYKQKVVAFCRENNRLKRDPYDNTKIIEVVVENSEVL